MTIWAQGYSVSQLNEIQARFNLRFPPELTELYLERRPAQGLDWLGDEKIIRDKMQWPLEGILFDVHQGIWWDHWGQKPISMEEREERVRGLVTSASKLIPIYGHRFIPETPSERGNPVFSVHQSDIIYYGADLTDYVQREFGTTLNSPMPCVKRIPFWSDFVEG